ncbi:MAG: metallophosphoesterase [Bacteroidota bacterium]
MERRNFIKKTMAAGTGIVMPLSLSAFDDLGKKAQVRLGMVADVHQDIIHDGVSRLRYFMEDMKARRPHAILQLGDFALPRKRNQPFLDVWNSFEGPRYHVLGNHDMRDLGYTREQTMTWWQMKDRYYSFDLNGLHCIVLDGNDVNPKPWSGYDRYIAEEQQQWLAHDLRNTQKPTLVFCHQSLESEGGIANGSRIRAILEGAKIAKAQPKVIACFSGHHHTDYVKEINGIPYIQINSMSYKWVGDTYRYARFAPHVEASYPTVSKTCPYRDPLYTVLTVDLEKGSLHLEGRETQFIPPSPGELNMPNADTMYPTITERNLNVAP